MRRDPKKLLSLGIGLGSALAGVTEALKQLPLDGPPLLSANADVMCRAQVQTAIEHIKQAMAIARTAISVGGERCGEVRGPHGTPSERRCKLEHGHDGPCSMVPP